MSTSKKAISILLTILMLLVGASSAIAGPPSHEKIVDEPVTWALPAGQCSAAPGGLTGNGLRHQVSKTTVNADGSMEIQINDLVKGSASDLGGGGNYNFVYSNHSVEIVPAGGGDHSITMVDSFVINGKGNIKHMAVGFNWRWTFTPPAGMWPPVDNWQQNSTRGDPLTCDPI